MGSCIDVTAVGDDRNYFKQEYEYLPQPVISTREEKMKHFKYDQENEDWSFDRAPIKKTVEPIQGLDATEELNRIFKQIGIDKAIEQQKRRQLYVVNIGYSIIKEEFCEPPKKTVPGFTFSDETWSKICRYR